MTIGIIDRISTAAIAEKRINDGCLPSPHEMASLVQPWMGDISDPEELFRGAENARLVNSEHVKMSGRIKNYGGAMHIPRTCATASLAAKKDVKMSAFEMLRRGFFNPQASGNTLPADWQSLWDALRVDISIRKTASPTIRENFYNIENMPNSDRIFSLQEMFPYFFEFKRNNAEGQAVNQGETLGGQTDTVEHFLYAVGFTRTLLSELYDKSFDTQKVSEGIAVAHNGLRDDLSISPIIAFNYAGVPGSQTPASTLSGAERQELLYNTLENAIDHLARRRDPTTGKLIAATDLAILCESEDAKHIQRVVNGFPGSGGQNAPKNLQPIQSISKIVAYDGETMIGRLKTVEYTGVTRGKCYLVKKNRYMNIGIKRGLTVETDMTPDVTTLARAKQSWYFVEGQYIDGLQYFVQEVTLPNYTPAPT